MSDIPKLVAPYGPTKEQLEERIDSLEEQLGETQSRHDQTVKDYKNLAETYRYDTGQLNLRIKQLEQALRGVKVLLERCIRADDFNDALTTINEVLGEP